MAATSGVKSSGASVMVAADVAFVRVVRSGARLVRRELTNGESASRKRRGQPMPGAAGRALASDQCAALPDSVGFARDRFARGR